ncbi:MAG: hypothetical protein U9N46_14110 [Euryarchaeota archaeon]|nr:hypothetical protein [Euryarchaeota archaeon]
MCQTSEPVNKGDLNSDGILNSADAAIALQLAHTTPQPMSAATTASPRSIFS